MPSTEYAAIGDDLKGRASSCGASGVSFSRGKREMHDSQQGQPKGVLYLCRDQPHHHSQLEAHPHPATPVFTRELVGPGELEIVIVPMNL